MEKARAYHRRPGHPGVKLPERGPPQIRQLFVELNERNITVTALARASSVCNDTIHSWKLNKTTARFQLLEDVYNALGYTLQPVPLPDHDPRVRFRVTDR